MKPQTKHEIELAYHKLLGVLIEHETEIKNFDFSVHYEMLQGMSKLDQAIDKMNKEYINRGL